MEQKQENVLNNARQSKKNMIVYKRNKKLFLLYIYAQVAELADAHDSKSCGKPCGFESHFGHQK